MSARPKASKPFYPHQEARVLLEHLAKLETRSFADQLTVIVREACKARGIDCDEVLQSESAEPVPK